MKFFKQFRFLNKLPNIPKMIFKYSKELKLTVTELDFIFKIYNYSHLENGITPSLSNMADRSWVSLRSLQRVSKKLQDKGILSVERRKDSEWKYQTNSYCINWLQEKLLEIDVYNTQLSMDFESHSIMWVESDINRYGYIAKPRVLDYYQNELELTTQENVFITYLLGYIDNRWIAEVSLNYASRTTPFSRTKLSEIIKSLSNRWYIISKEQFKWKGKYKKKNRYDLSPLMNKLNELERSKVEKILREKWEWKDYNTQRKAKWISNTFVPEEKADKRDNRKIQKRREFLLNEISRFQSQYISKDSHEAQLVREYQQELNGLENESINNWSLKNLMMERFKKLKQKPKTPWNNNLSKFEFYEARELCKRTWWDWKKDFNFYIKSVKTFPNVYRKHLASAIELWKNTDRYFKTCMWKEFTKLTIIS